MFQLPHFGSLLARENSAASPGMNDTQRQQQMRRDKVWTKVASYYEAIRAIELTGRQTFLDRLLKVPELEPLVARR
jgi:hypothetical protein